MKQDNDRKAFLYYFDWAEALLELPDDVRLKIDDAVKRYVLYGEEPTDPIVKYSMFAMMRLKIDKDTEAYAEKCEYISKLRSEVGKKGNDIRWGDNRKVSQTSQSVAKVAKHRKASQTSLDTDTVTNTDIDNNKKELSYESEKKGGVVVAARAATLTRREAFYNSLVPYVGKYGAEMIRAFFDYWSEMNKSETKMRFEQQPTWELAKRLATWAKRDRVEARPRLSAFGSTAADAKSQRDAEFVAHIQQKMHGG